jgi:hypothetical protein
VLRVSRRDRLAISFTTLLSSALVLAGPAAPPTTACPNDGAGPSSADQPSTRVAGLHGIGLNHTQPSLADGGADAGRNISSPLRTGRSKTYRPHAYGGSVLGFCDPWVQTGTESTFGTVAMHRPPRGPMNRMADDSLPRHSVAGDTAGAQFDGLDPSTGSGAPTVRQISAWHRRLFLDPHPMPDAFDSRPRGIRRVR